MPSPLPPDPTRPRPSEQSFHRILTVRRAAQQGGNDGGKTQEKGRPRGRPQLAGDQQIAEGRGGGERRERRQEHGREHGAEPLPATSPPPGEELRAAAADLRHLQGFLAAVARCREESDLPPADAELAAQAARQAEAVAAVAEVLEKLLD